MASYEDWGGGEGGGGGESINRDYRCFHLCRGGRAVKLPARVSQVQRTAESPGHKQTEKHTLCFAAFQTSLRMHCTQQESTCPSAVQGQSSVFCLSLVLVKCVVTKGEHTKISVVQHRNVSRCLRHNYITINDVRIRGWEEKESPEYLPPTRLRSSGYKKVSRMNRDFLLRLSAHVLILCFYFPPSGLSALQHLCSPLWDISISNRTVCGFSAELLTSCVCLTELIQIQTYLHRPFQGNKRSSSSTSSVKRLIFISLYFHISRKSLIMLSTCLKEARCSDD